MKDLVELKDRLGQPDPPSRDAQLAARAALLREIEAARAPARRRRRRGVRLGWLAGATAVTATVAVVVTIAVAPRPTEPTPPGQQAAGPSSSQLPSELSGPQVLLNAAAAALASPASAGAYWHVKQEIPVPDTPKPIQTFNEWTARDGTRYTMPDGYPGAFRVSLDVGFYAGGSLLTLEQLERLPTDPDALTAWMTDSYLRPSRPPAPGITPGLMPADGNAQELPAEELLNMVAGGLSRLLWQVPAPPAVRSAALRALAAMPNVTNLGARDGGQALRIFFGLPPADKYPDGKVPPGAGELILIIDPATSTLLSSTTYEGTTRILEATWTDDPPKIVPVPTE
jgi:hypothetical protein